MSKKMAVIVLRRLGIGTSGQPQITGKLDLHQVMDGEVSSEGIVLMRKCNASLGFGGKFASIATLFCLDRCELCSLAFA
ncbi:MAG: hypothetical protein ACRCYV_03195 [Aeromonas sp.]